MPKTAPRTKADFYRRWQAMEFGNRIRMWRTQQELRQSAFSGTVTARSKVPGGPCVYRVPALLAATEAAYGGCAFNESAPDDLLLLQGEFTHATLEGYALYASLAKLPMRQALRGSGVQYYGLQALGRMQHYCNARSYQMILDLLDEYPDAVVEFGCYSCHVGELPGHNTLVWEVRAY